MICIPTVKDTQQQNWADLGGDIFFTCDAYHCNVSAPQYAMQCKIYHHKVRQVLQRILILGLDWKALCGFISLSSVSFSQKLAVTGVRWVIDSIRERSSGYSGPRQNKHHRHTHALYYKQMQFPAFPSSHHLTNAENTSSSLSQI